MKNIEHASAPAQTGYIISEDAELQIKTIAKAIDTLSALCDATRTANDVEIHTSEIASILNVFANSLKEISRDLPFGFDVKAGVN